MIGNEISGVFVIIFDPYFTYSICDHILILFFMFNTQIDQNFPVNINKLFCTHYMNQNIPSKKYILYCCIEYNPVLKYYCKICEEAALFYARRVGEYTTLQPNIYFVNDLQHFGPSAV